MFKTVLIGAFVALSIISTETYTAQTRPAHQFSPDLFSDLSYRMVGPSRGGRVTAVAGHRDQPSTFYMGASGGGVWKTTDYGLTWHSISDGYFATGSIGAIRVADPDPDVIYVGTGSDGLRSNVIIGKGVYKSKDAGQTWEHSGLGDVGNIGAVLIHPDNPDLVYVAAIGNPFAPNPERGVYRSNDGGESWEKVLYLSDKTGAVDLEFAPDNADEIYATMWRAERKPWTIISGAYEGGIYKTSDGGNTWDQLSQGLPSGLFGKADLAVSAGDPNRVYVLIEAPGDKGGVYRSDDRGENWRQVSDFDKIQTRPFYYCNLEAHPTNPDILWGMTEGFWKSEDAGHSWKKQDVPHGDNHDMWINPDNPDVFVQSNDGGANVTVNGGETWSTQHNQPTAELYQVNVSDGFPYRLYAGQQDNTTISVPSLPPRSMPGGYTALWEAEGGCETGPAIPKPGDPDIVYSGCKGRFGIYNRRTGSEQQYYVGFWNIYGHNPRDLAYRFQRVAPIHVSPHDPEQVYHASQFVHMTTDGGKTWETISPDLTAFDPKTQVVSGTPITIDVTGEEHFSTIYDVQESPHEPGVIWVGANDGPIHITRNSGRDWKDVTPKKLGPHGRVQNIEVSPHQAAKAYASILRYQLGDFEPYVYRTRDYGESWVRITTGKNGIPLDTPVRVVREDPEREGLLYAGTEFGMFISFDDGGHWQPFQQNLPVTPVTDIKVVDQDLALSTMGRGFWILDNLTPLREISERVIESQAHLFSVVDAYRVTVPEKPGGLSNPADPQFKVVGANLDYFLKSEPGNEIRLEILDTKGHIIRRYSSGETSKPDEKTTQNTLEQQQPKLVKLPGVHRFTWDLRYSGLQGFDPGKRTANKVSALQDNEPILDADNIKTPEEESQGERAMDHVQKQEPENKESRGPTVPPGMYQARLIVGEWSDTHDFEVKMDPRVLAEGITADDVRAQTELLLQVRDSINELRETFDKTEQRLSGIQNQLVADPVRYSQPKLADQLKYLYQNLQRSDQVPGQDAYQRFEDLSRALEGPLGELEQMLNAGEIADGDADQ